MKQGITRAFAVIGATSVLVMGFDAVTYAATGSSLILGRTNTAGATTTISNTGAGAAITLKTKSSVSAPIVTNGKGLVKNLNAEKVGGNTAALLIAKSAPKSLVFKDTATSQTGNLTYTAFTVPKGTWLITFNANVDLNDNGTAASPTSPNQMICYLFDGSKDWGEGEWTSINSTWYASPSFARVATFTAAKSMTLSCNTSRGAGWSVLPDGYGPTVAFTKIGSSTTAGLSGGIGVS
jgi:hypothetical protein